MSEIPETLQDISADWLSQVLSADVAEVTVVDAHEGTTGRGELNVCYASPTTLPEALFVKLPPTDEMQRAFVVSSGMGLRESRFYQQLAAEVPLRTPRCFHADTNPSGERYIMLLESLTNTGCTFRNANLHYSRAYLESMMKQFAALHAAYWDSPRFDVDLDWIEPPPQHPIAVTLVEQALSEHGAKQPPVFRALAETYLEHTNAVHALWNDGGVPTLVHGDAHDGNLFMDGATPGFLDWALAARAPAMRDVGYFLAATLLPEDRQAWLGPLLDGYRGHLLERGVDAPSPSVLREQMRWHAAYVWVGTAVTLAMGDAWQPVEYVQSTLDKLHHTLAAEQCVESLIAAL